MTPPIAEGILSDRRTLAAAAAPAISLEPRLRWRLPHISVITPSFQQGHFLGRTIESIHGQARFGELNNFILGP